MNWDRIAASWDQTKASIRQKWSKLTDDDVGLIGGKKDMLLAKLRERYGLAKDKAENEVDSWMESIDEDKSNSTRPRV